MKEGDMATSVLKPGDLSTMQKCVEKITEVVGQIEKCGVRVYQIRDVSIPEYNFGIATLDINLDFRAKTEE